MTTTRKSKHTIFVLKLSTLVLSVAILACLAILFVTHGAFAAKKPTDNDGDGSDGIPPTQITEYTLPRGSVQGVNFTGGEGDDTPLHTFSLGADTYLVGTTTSHTLDMTSAYEGSNLFVAHVDAAGCVKRTVVFGTNCDDFARAAHLTERGLSVLGESLTTSDNITLYTVDYAALTVSARPIKHSLRYTAEDFATVGADTAIVLSRQDAATGARTLTVDLLHDNVSRKSISVPANCTYTAIYPSANGWTIVGTAYAGNYANPVVIRASENECEITHILAYETKLELLSCHPTAAGWRMLVTTLAGTRLLDAMHDGTAKTLADFTERERGIVLPWRNGNCVFFRGTESAYTVQYGDVAAIRPAATILDGRISANGGVELLVTDEAGLYSLSVGYERKRIADINPSVGEWGNGYAACVQFPCGMGGFDAALVNPNWK